MASAKRPNILSSTVALLSAFIAAFLLANCASDSSNTIEVEKTSGFQASHGPFDKNGNYVEKWADSPPKRKYVRTAKSQPEPHRPPNLAPQRRPSVTASIPKPKVTTPRPRPRPTQTYTPPKPRPTITKAKPKPKPKPILVKPKRRPTINHTVRKGDTLYALSRKYSTSPAAIQKANNISGTNIRIGQTLKIPRY